MKHLEPVLSGTGFMGAPLRGQVRVLRPDW